MNPPWKTPHETPVTPSATEPGKFEAVADHQLYSHSEQVNIITGEITTRQDQVTFHEAPASLPRQRHHRLDIATLIFVAVLVTLLVLGSIFSPYDNTAPESAGNPSHDYWQDYNDSR